MTYEPQLRKLYNGAEIGTMRVVGLMSGSGTNLRKIIEHEKKLDSERGKSPYEVVAIFTDNPESNAVSIGVDFDLPVVTRSLRSFYKARGKHLRDMDVRKEFDEEAVRTLSPYRATVAAYAGFMSIATEPLIESFLGVNVHSADLTIMEDERRKYTGGNAVEKAILGGEVQLRSTTHIIEERVDYGRNLMISAPIGVRLPKGFCGFSVEQEQEVFSEHQNRLKVEGDWKIFPLTLEFIADGKYEKDEEGRIHFEGIPAPRGVWYEGLEKIERN